jgi:ketosteroid isomerase-like protein
MRSRKLSTLIGAFCLLSLLTISVPAQDAADAAGQVRRLEEKWTEAYKQRQINILSTLLTDDFVITVEDGNTYSKAGYITHSVDSSTKVEVAELSDLRVRVRAGGNIAVVTGAYHEIGRTNGKPYEYHDRLTDVWVRVGSNWRVLSSHYSVPLKQ